MNKQDFDYFLHEYYAENNPEVLDDALPDCTADWIADLDCEEFIRLGNLYCKKETKGLLDTLKIALDAINHLESCGKAKASFAKKKLERAILKAEGGSND